MAADTAKKAVSDAARIAEELRQEHEHGSQIERLRRTLESQVKELQMRLDEAEANAMKGGKRMLQKMEQRVRELEVELDSEQRRHQETTKGMRKQDRRLKVGRCWWRNHAIRLSSFRYRVTNLKGAGEIVILILGLEYFTDCLY